MSPKIELEKVAKSPRHNWKVSEPRTLADERISGLNDLSKAILWKPVYSSKAVPAGPPVDGQPGQVLCIIVYRPILSYLAVSAFKTPVGG